MSTKVMRLLTILLLLMPALALAGKCSDDYELLLEKERKILQLYKIQSGDAHKQYVDLANEANDSLSVCTKSPELNSLMADIQIVLGRNDLALNYAKEALSQDSNSWEANQAYGAVLSLIGEVENGLVYLERSVEIYPDNPSLLINLCSTYEMARKYREAIASCSRAIALNDTKSNGAAYYIRGRAYQSVKQEDMAREDFTKARDLGFKGEKFYSEEHYSK